MLSIFATALAAGAIQAVTGFGAGIILMLVLPFYFSMVVSAGISSSICCGLSLILAWKYRSDVQWRMMLLPTAVYVAASTLSIQAVRSMDTGLLSAGFGVFLMLVGF